MGRYERWMVEKVPKRIISGHNGETIISIDKALVEGKIEWRMTGSTQLELRSIIEPTRRCLLTVGSTSGNPVYAAKVRSFLRKV